MDNNQHNNQHNNPQLLEGLEQGDLNRLVHNELHIDEYKSKMGDDQDIVVLSFKIGGKEPANDLVNFVEKSYDWVLDADTSSGEMDDGDYVVFIELERDPQVPAHIMELLEDLAPLAAVEMPDWRVQFHKVKGFFPADLESLSSHIPRTPDEYARAHGKMQQELDSLKAASGVEVKTTAPKNSHTESLRIAAGIL